MITWSNTKLDELEQIVCTSPNESKYFLCLSPNSKNIINNDYEVGNTRIIPININNKPTLLDIKTLLLSLQQDYDSSDEVNIFTLNGDKVWLDKNTRVGLFNLLNLEKLSNKETTTLWFNDKSITVNIDKAIKLLTAVEIYAKQCYDNTQKHYAEINKLKSIEEALAYDITAGYPEILNINIE